MTARLTLAAVALALLFGGAPASAEPAAEPAAAPGGCLVRAWPDARYRGVGYDHVVHLASTCDYAVRCTVTTNASPRRMAATLPPRGSRELLTYRNSPFRRFTISVRCARVPDPR